MWSGVRKKDDDGGVDVHDVYDGAECGLLCCGYLKLKFGSINDNTKLN